MAERFLSINLVIVQFHPAAARDLHRGPLRDLDVLLIGATDLGGYEFLIGVDQVFVSLYSEDLFIRRLDLEVAISGGSFRIFDVESSKAILPEVGFEDLASLAIVDSPEFEALAEFRG